MTPNEFKELEVQKAINKHIDDFNSFRFNAGAGSGKTYALIEALKYVAVNKIAATKSPQKVVCITYTNVAVNEIKSRLGNSETVHVSTIHEKLWEIIKRAQPELIICHKEKIEEVIKKNNQDLFTSDKAKFFNALNESQQLEFIEFSKQTQEIFYQSNRLMAKPFVDAYKNNKDINSPVFLDGCLKSTTNFKYVVGLLYKNQRLKECLERINAGEEKRVDYDNKVNSDRLHYMKFSHDTLLEYGLKLVETYPTLCRIIIDSYLYFFIDEYQDTHSNVVKLIKIIHSYAVKHNKRWMVGYFGDTAQSIYDAGVGRKILDIHDGLVNVNKVFNRRSHQQIIDVANNIRADEIVQVPIFEERNSGSVRFSYNNWGDKSTTAIKFLDEYKADLIEENRELGGVDDKEIRIHCLVLTNKLMAILNGFGDVYDVFNKSTIYYKNLNTQVLSQQLEKLHPTVLSIYRFVKLYRDIQQGKVSYDKIFGASSKDMSFSTASLAVRELEKGEVTSLKGWVNLIIDRLENSNVKEALGKVLINCVNYEKHKVASTDKFQSVFFDNMNALMNVDSENEDSAKERVDSVLALPLVSLIKWVNYIDGNHVKSDVISYHTYHGTKGEEYKNVAIIMEHSFGRNNKDKFKNFFKVIQQGAREDTESLFLNPETKEKHINTQNLLYVACTRAIKNLRVLYLDDISEIKNGIETIFGESKPWPIEE